MGLKQQNTNEQTLDLRQRIEQVVQLCHQIKLKVEHIREENAELEKLYSSLWSVMWLSGVNMKKQTKKWIRFYERLTTVAGVFALITLLSSCRTQKPQPISESPPMPKVFAVPAAANAVIVTPPSNGVRTIIWRVSAPQSLKGYSWAADPSIAGRATKLFDVEVSDSPLGPWTWIGTTGALYMQVPFYVTKPNQYFRVGTHIVLK